MSGNTSTWNRLFKQVNGHNSSKQFWVLLDPDRESPSELRDATRMSIEMGADAILVGSSYYERDEFDQSVLAVRDGCAGRVPVLLFPGNHRQLSPYADALLFLSLLSGRNAQYLIGEQMLAAPHIRRIGLETIPTGYLLIESGRVTSVQSVTGTDPIPRTKPELIAAHALAGQFLGNKLVYLEAGSGARWHVPESAIELTRTTIDVPLIVGGGIRTPEVAERVAIAGADIIVIGNVLEDKRSQEFTRELADAVHSVSQPVL